MADLLMAQAIHGIPVVADAPSRDALYPVATRQQNQRVQRLDTGSVERWNGSVWLVDVNNSVVIDVVREGADPTGITDSSAIFYTACAKLNALGAGTLLIPPGRYKVYPVGYTTYAGLGDFSNMTSVLVSGYGATLVVPPAQDFSIANSGSLTGSVWHFTNSQNVMVEGLRWQWVDANGVGQTVTSGVSLGNGREFIRTTGSCRNVAWRDIDLTGSNGIVVEQLTTAAFTVSSITRVGQVATATTVAVHGLATGAFVDITGADQNEYNGTFLPITVTSTTTFTYPVTGSPATPATKLTGPLAITGGQSRTTGINYTNYRCKNVYYGFLANGQGDDVKGDMTTDDTHRSYHVFGVNRHRVRVVGKNAKANDCYISPGGNCSDIEIDYTNHNTTDGATSAHGVVVEFGTVAYTYRNIKVKVDVIWPATITTGQVRLGQAFKLWKTDNAGAPLTTDPGHVLDGFDFSGSMFGPCPLGSIGCNAGMDASSQFGTGDIFRNFNVHDVTLNGNGNNAYMDWRSDSYQSASFRNIDAGSHPVRIRGKNPTGAYWPITVGIVAVSNIKCGNLNTVVTGTGYLQGVDTALPVAFVYYDGSITLPLGWSGKLIQMANAADQTYTLPASAAGLEYTIQRNSAAGNVIAPPVGADTLDGLATPNALKGTTNGATARVYCVAAGKWQSQRIAGTWTNNNGGAAWVFA